VAALRQSANDGNVGMRILALLGGVSLFVASFLGFVGRILQLQLIRGLFEIYAFACAVVALVLESKQLQLPPACLRRLYQYALFLKFVWGRGCLYFVAGSFQLLQGGLFDFIVGAFVMFVGVVFVVVGRRTAKKLAELRQILYSEDTLRSKFQEADVDSTGSLSKDQFRTLLLSLGTRMTTNETEAAYMHLGQDSGSLTYNQFRSWWANFDVDDPRQSITV